MEDRKWYKLQLLFLFSKGETLFLSLSLSLCFCGVSKGLHLQVEIYYFPVEVSPLVSKTTCGAGLSE